MSKYVVFGAGPSGLYTAWRLLTGGKLTADDTVQLIEWGHYSFTEGDNGTRNPAGRICSYPYQGDPGNSYIEIGGMRYLEWDESTAEGHQLVSETIERLDLKDQVVNFFTTENPLYYLRGQHFYQDQLGKGASAPYNTVPFARNLPPDALFSYLSSNLIGDQELDTRAKQCEFYANGVLPDNFRSDVYKPGDVVSNIGYWNAFYDQEGNEAFNYAAMGGGYTSNVINWNAANAAIYNGEFAPGGAFKTLSTGYSTLFSTLFSACVNASKTEENATFIYTPKTRLHSIWYEGDQPCYRLAKKDDPDRACGEVERADYVFLAMPPESIDLVSQATRYSDIDANQDFLNDHGVRNYLSSVIKQPSYKVAMFFDKPWWKEAKYAPNLTASDGTTDNVFGPTITDLALRQVYYFGNNAPLNKEQEVYGLLASYDDMVYSTFWRELELSPQDRREQSIEQDLQPLEGARQAPEVMENMLLRELAWLHYGEQGPMHDLKDHLLETRFMDWGLNPFGAGYHAWAAHYDIADVMDKIRTPAVMAGAEKANLFIVGSAYSNDQAWVEGAFATAESVLVDYLDMETIAASNYKLICTSGCKSGQCK